MITNTKAKKKKLCSHTFNLLNVVSYITYMRRCGRIVLAIMRAGEGRCGRVWQCQGLMRREGWRTCQTEREGWMVGVAGAGWSVSDEGGSGFKRGTRWVLLIVASESEDEGVGLDGGGTTNRCTHSGVYVRVGLFLSPRPCSPLWCIAANCLAAQAAPRRCWEMCGMNHFFYIISLDYWKDVLVLYLKEYEPSCSRSNFTKMNPFLSIDFQVERFLHYLSKRAWCYPWVL